MNDRDELLNRIAMKIYEENLTEPVYVDRDGDLYKAKVGGREGWGDSPERAIDRAINRGPLQPRYKARPPLSWWFLFSAGVAAVVLYCALTRP